MASRGDPVLHIIYPHRDRISCPDAIGRNLVEFFSKRVKVRAYELNEPRRIEPARGDVLLGHPSPAWWSPFRRCLGDSRWSRRIAIFPFVHTDYRQCAFFDSMASRCDEVLTITGHYWFSTAARSRYAHWVPRMKHLDLAIDRRHFPFVKTGFRKPGERRFLYIGHGAWMKNVPYLNRIAERRPNWTFAWIGETKSGHRHLQCLGSHDFSKEAARALVAEYDFLICTSTADANPTTILEAMSWGLIPVCTPTCGYDHEAGIPNIPLDDVDGAIEILERLQHLDEADLRQMQRHNLQRLQDHYNWERFCGQVSDSVFGTETAPMPRQSFTNALVLRAASMASPYAPFRYRSLQRSLRRRFLRTRR
jgi:glycosyltransferase involved in cell wall biosynthesis